ncbi:MAG: hypothetical protein JKX72_01470 [Robiginitomaculum sp.]|nr:hypothetical protein [Robiginitomaculum sp.]
MALRVMIKHIPLVLSLYAVGVFASATTLAQLSSARGEGGIWVQLCATGARMFIDLSGKDETPAPRKTHAQACHACGDDRRILKHKDDTPDEI